MNQFLTLVNGLALLGMTTQAAVAASDWVVQLPNESVRSTEILDYAHARPLQPTFNGQIAPKTNEAASRRLTGMSGMVEGGSGSGQMLPTQLLDLATSERLSQASPEAGSRAYGSAGAPFTTSRVDMAGLQLSKTEYFRRAGRLFFKVGADTGVCSASLIKPGVVVTAAHCVAEFGSGTGYNSFQYVPAYYKGQAPYGTWSVSNAYVMNSYLNGTADCAQAGIVCTNDIAVLKLAPQSGKYAGHYTGWFGYAWNGYGEVEGETQITQLGYPVSHDGGEMMQRTDAAGKVYAEFSDNTLIGSRQTGGSSGGPWLVNFGEVAKLQGTTVGNAGKANVVVGTTSWGPTDPALKFMGASPFTSDNIVLLMKGACPTKATAGCK